MFEPINRLGLFDNIAADIEKIFAILSIVCFEFKLYFLFSICFALICAISCAITPVIPSGYFIEEINPVVINILFNSFINALGLLFNKI